MGAGEVLVNLSLWWLRSAAADRSARSPVQRGGFYDTYTQIQDIGRFVPVAASVPGCPPRIENLIDAIKGLQRKISRNG